MAKEHTPEFNEAHFDNPAAWPDDGRGWSRSWGSVSEQWNAVIEPELRGVGGSGLVVDIGCGHGRWVEFLSQRFDNYVGVDLSGGCVDYCTNRFPSLAFKKCNGRSIPLDDKSASFVFSFDSLVHVDCASSVAYIADAWRVLRDGGSAFLHLSTFATSGAESNDGWRATDGDWREYAKAIPETCDATIQLIAWMQSKWLNDCFVSFRKMPGSGTRTVVERRDFMESTASG